MGKSPMKLCECIALTTGRKTDAQKKLTDLHQLTQKAGLFTGQHKTYQPRDENDRETLPEERQEIQLRVSDVVRQAEGTLGNLYDLIVTQDSGNQSAKSDIVLADGRVVLKDVPVTSLLYLEKQLEDLKKFYATLPTLDPAKSWVKDSDNRCHRSVTTKTRTKRNKIPVVLYHATTEHPAQTQLVEEDKIVGDYMTVEFSGAITPNEKATLLERVAALKDAVVLARERANQTVIDQKRAGDTLFKYLHAGVV
jgi:type III secretory pathway component EscV